MWFVYQHLISKNYRGAGFVTEAPLDSRNRSLGRMTVEPSSIGSRHLLLAAGWLMARLPVSLFDSYLQALMTDIQIAYFLPPFNRDTWTLPSPADTSAALSDTNAQALALRSHLAEELERAGENARNSDQQSTATAQKLIDHRANQILLARGKLRHALRTVTQKRTRLARLALRLEAIQLHATIRGPRKRPLSAYELHLLADHDDAKAAGAFARAQNQPSSGQSSELQHHAVALDSWLAEAQGCDAIDKHERLWWAWMVRVEQSVIASDLITCVVLQLAGQRARRRARRTTAAGSCESAAAARARERCFLRHRAAR